MNEVTPNSEAEVGDGAPHEPKKMLINTALTDNQALAGASALRRAVTRMWRRLRVERPHEGFSLAKLNILGSLQTEGSLAAGELASRERTQPQSLTRVLAELQEQGLISKTPDSTDRRRTILAITPAGTRLLVRTMRERDTWLASAMESELTPTERELLRLACGLLDRIADA